MSLDLDGILHVTAIEKCSGKAKHVTIARALETKSEAEIAEARKRLEVLYATRSGEDTENEQIAWLEAATEKPNKELEPQEIDEGSGGKEDLADTCAAAPVPTNGIWAEMIREGRQLVDRSRQLLAQMHEEDREEVIALNEQIEAAIAATNESALKDGTKKLRELLFFVKGKY
jgi:molecular chaperone DnaK (HSP70)